MTGKTNSYVELRQNRDGQDRPYVVGTRIRVQDLVIDHERCGRSAEEIAAGFDHVSLAQVHGALAYYFDNHDFVRACIHADETYAESVRDQLTTPVLSSPPATADVGDASISS